MNDRDTIPVKTKLEVRMKSRQNRISLIVGIIVLCAAIGYNLWTVGMYELHGLDADSASELVMASVLNDEGTMFTENWYYSTEMRLVSPVPVYQLALKLFPSWHAARVFADAILMIGSAVSLIFAAYAAGAGNEAFFAASMLVLPYSWNHRFYFTWYGHYTAYFMLACWIFTLIMHLSRKNHMAVRIPLLVVLSFWGGLNGVRMLMMIGAPLFLTTLYLALREIIVERKQIRDIIKDEHGLLILMSLIAMIAMFIGYQINANVFAPRYDFDEYSNSQLRGFSFGTIFTWLDSFLDYLGYQTEVPMLSAHGLVDVFLIAFVTFGVIAPFVLIRRNDEGSKKSRIVPVLALIATLLGMLVVMIIDDDYFQVNADAICYFFVGIVFLSLTVFMLLSRWLEHVPVLRMIVMVAIVALFAVEAQLSIESDVPDYPTARERAAHWLAENGYYEGFATYWNGNILTVFTDGELEVTLFSAWDTPYPMEGLQIKQHLESFPEGPIFVLVDEGELSNYVPFADDEHLVYQEENIYVYIFDTAQEVIDTL